MSQEPETERATETTTRTRRKPNRFVAAADRRWGARNIEWINGSGPWALVSNCPPARTITLWKTYGEAKRQKTLLGNLCGHLCQGQFHHPIYFLGARRGRAHGRTGTKVAQP
jgi:hypothetical protein